jgi:hypothetical protein
MDYVLTKIVKEQNQILLEDIAKHYNKNINELKKMYLTPTFYKIQSDKKNYEINYLNNTKK